MKRVKTALLGLVLAILPQMAHAADAFDDFVGDYLEAHRHVVVAYLAQDENDLTLWRSRQANALAELRDALFGADAAAGISPTYGEELERIGSRLEQDPEGVLDLADALNKRWEERYESDLVALRKKRIQQGKTAGLAAGSLSALLALRSVSRTVPGSAKKLVPRQLRLMLFTFPELGAAIGAYGMSKIEGTGLPAGIPIPPIMGICRDRCGTNGQGDEANPDKLVREVLVDSVSSLIGWGSVALVETGVLASRGATVAREAAGVYRIFKVGKLAGAALAPETLGAGVAVILVSEAAEWGLKKGIHAHERGKYLQDLWNKVNAFDKERGSLSDVDALRRVQEIRKAAMSLNVFVKEPFYTALTKFQEKVEKALGNPSKIAKARKAFIASIRSAMKTDEAHKAADLLGWAERAVRASGRKYLEFEADALGQMASFDGWNALVDDLEAIQ